MQPSDKPDTRQAAGPCFPDGQLFLTLGGASSPVPVSEALGRMLRDLGVRSGSIPQDQNERASRYRSVTAGLKLLIVLDDAENAAQVRPLLPGADGSAVIVTSRAKLADLAGVSDAELSALGSEDSTALLRAIVGEDRISEDREGTAGSSPPAAACRWRSGSPGAGW